MPDHTRNRLNGIVLDGLRSSELAPLQGRTTNLPIYEIRIGSLVSADTGGPNFIELVQSMEKDNMRDLKKRGDGQPFQNLKRQPTDHGDRAGNLPLAPPRLGYREYNIPSNGFANPGYPRLVADITNKRLYITPTHYDPWFDTVDAIRAAGAATPGTRNPFFLLRGVFVYNPLFD